MTQLTRETIQSLAVLRAVSRWQSGAFGPVRVHKTLFFADQQNDRDWTIFTYKRWYLGQYSDTISCVLNDLKRARRIHCDYDGPSERIVAKLSAEDEKRIRRFFSAYFPEWERGFARAFKKWAYLTNDDLIKLAHDDPSYTTSKHGEVILKSRLPKLIEFTGLTESEAESLTDLVNEPLHDAISKRLNRAAARNAVGEDWESIYFGDD